MCDELNQVPAIPYISPEEALSTYGHNRMGAPLGLIPGSPLNPSVNFHPNDLQTGLYWINGRLHYTRGGRDQGELATMPAAVPGVILLENKTGGTVSPGQVVAMHSSGAGFQLASSADNSKNAIGIVIETLIDTAVGRVQVEGIVKLSDWTAGTGGSSLSSGKWWLSTTPGLLTATAPSSTGNLVQRVGVRLSDTELDLQLGPKWVKS